MSKVSLFDFSRYYSDNTLPNDMFANWDLVQELPIAIYACDSEGRIIFYNEAAVDLWGKTPRIGKDHWCGSYKIYKTDGTPLPLDSCPMSVALKEKREVKDYEIIVERPDGQRFNILPHPKPIFNNKGELYGAINMLVDITDKREKEAALAESEHKYRLLSQSLEKQVVERTLSAKKNEERYHKMVEEVEDYAILMLDIDGTILNWNRGAEKIKGYSEKEIVGKNFRVFYLEKDRESKLPDKLIQTARNEGKAVHEGWRLRKNGTRFWGTIVITALHGENNEIIGFSKVTRDLTERKLAEDKLREYSEDIEVRNRQLAEYAYVASHDLQEPLRKIQIFSDLLERALDNKKKARTYIAKITSSAQRMVTLIKGILQYSQAEQLESLFTEVNLNKTVQEVMDDFELQIDQKNAKIVLHSDLPVITGIPIQLHQLFSNLFSNSLKFTGNSPVIELTCDKVHVKMDDYPDLIPKEYFKIVFKDNGVGFDEKYSNQVFKLFKRLNTNISGVGIGLALCKKIVEKHKGHIEIKTAINKGTEFTILLPG